MFVTKKKNYHWIKLPISDRKEIKLAKEDYAKKYGDTYKNIGDGIFLFALISRCAALENELKNKDEKIEIIENELEDYKERFFRAYK